jgi:hypothetical protein
LRTASDRDIQKISVVGLGSGVTLEDACVVGILAKQIRSGDGCPPNVPGTKPAYGLATLVFR